jgi:putative FmdB family regulatory protein
MPAYTYKCTEHGHQFEVRQRMADAPLAECPVCGGPVRRVVGSVGVVFKGSGFYVTDNRNGNNGSSAKANGTSANGSHTNEAAKASEPAKKPDGESVKPKAEKATAVTE